MPQGGIDPGEEPRDNCLPGWPKRPVSRRPKSSPSRREWLYYDLPDELIGTIRKGRYAGQRQKWFAMRFLGTDADVNIEPSTRSSATGAGRPSPSCRGCRPV